MYKDIIKFLESDENIQVVITCISDNLVKLFFEDHNKPSDDILLSGFEVLNEHTLENQSDDYYYGYTTLYQDIDENTVILSNDGSIYTEQKIDISEDIDFVIVEPTVDEKIYEKIQELSYICHNKIVNGVDVDIDGETEHFSYGEEDQVNIKELFDLSIQTNVPLYYHPDGGSCKLYTVAQIASIYATNATNKMHHITYFNQLKLYVSTLDNIKAIDKIAYGDELTGIYLETYNNAMAQAKVGLETFMGGGE